MNKERILQRFAHQYNLGPDAGVRSNRTQTKKLLDTYCSIPLTLPISDENVKRVCEVLTLAGYITTDSCEGHKRNLPHIYLYCESHYHLRHLDRIIYAESREKNFDWQIKLGHTGDVLLNLVQLPTYCIEPDATRRIAFENEKHDRNLIDDLDIIGISVIRYFSSVDLQRLEKFRREMDSQAIRFKVPTLPKII